MSKEVQQMFHSIATRYDFTNDVLSFGMHRLWRRRAISVAGISPGQTVLDICAGTGDLAFQASSVVGKEGCVLGVDFVHSMLSLARNKNLIREMSGKASVPFIQGDAMQLPLRDNTFDAVTVSFGIRNVDDPLHALKEMKRVTKAGGCVLVLEFGQPYLPVFKSFYAFYGKYIMPRIGGLLTGNRGAYEYLPETADAFIAGDEFTQLMDDAGLEEARSYPLLFGLAYIYHGSKRSGG